jgi:hypothetical protein
LNTADDRTLTLLGFCTGTGTLCPGGSQAANFPVTQYVTNLDQFGRYKTVEVSMNRRYSNKWSASIGGGYTWMNNFPEGFPQHPNQPFDEDRTTWNVKATASYDAAWGIRISPVLRHQSGVNYARTLAITVPAGSGLAVSGTTMYAEPANANREDNIWVFDVRAEKNVEITSRIRTRLYLDLFNLTNSHASETIGRATGTSYQKPTAILAPFTARVGFRFIF